MDSITEKIAWKMKDAGCSKVYLGIESGNDKVLKLMNKGISALEIKKGVEIYRSNGMLRILHYGLS